MVSSCMNAGRLGLARGTCWLLGLHVPLNSCPALVILSLSAPVELTDGDMDLFSLEAKGYFPQTTFPDLTCCPQVLLDVMVMLQDGHP